MSNHLIADTEPRHQEIREAVIETLFLLGIDVTTPEAIQDFRKDVAHIREWRLSVEEVKKKSLLTAVSFITTAIVGYIMLLLAKQWAPL